MRFFFFFALSPRFLDQRRYNAGGVKLGLQRACYLSCSASSRRPFSYFWWLLRIFLQVVVLCLIWELYGKAVRPRNGICAPECSKWCFSVLSHHLWSRHARRRSFRTFSHMLNGAASCFGHFSSPTPLFDDLPLPPFFFFWSTSQYASFGFTASGVGTKITTTTTHALWFFCACLRNTRTSLFTQREKRSCLFVSVSFFFSLVVNPCSFVSYHN